MVLNGTKRFQLHQYSITFYIFLQKKKKKNHYIVLNTESIIFIIFFYGNYLLVKHK